MALSLSPSPKLQFFANNGTPLDGGYLYTYVAGAPSTAKTSYSDSAWTPNTNPIVLDSAGRCSLWLDGFYYMEMWTGDKTVDGSTLLWTQDNVAPGASSSFAVQRFSGDGATLTFTLSDTIASVNDMWVFVEGVYQHKNTYSISGTELIFDLAPPDGTNNVEVVMTPAVTAVSGQSNQDSGSAAPTTGTYPLGWIRWNSAPVAGENIGWVCVTAGTPGTWAAFGSISL